MIKNSLIFVVITTLATSIIAGGDDRDVGPIESLEVMAPSAEYSVGNQPTKASVNSRLTKTPVATQPRKTSVNSQFTKTPVATQPIKAPVNSRFTKTPITTQPTKALVNGRLTKTSVDTQLTETSVEKLKLTTVKKTGFVVVPLAPLACQEKLGLTESNIAIFRKAQATGNLYNTGPIGTSGTEFSPHRWDKYFACVAQNRN